MVAIERRPVTSLEDGAEALAKAQSDIAYTWHDMTGERVGRGMLIIGAIVGGRPLARRCREASSSRPKWRRSGSYLLNTP
ncbi:MAG: hypothetical protein WDM79_02345 [Terricaulis sp.]